MLPKQEASKERTISVLMAAEAYISRQKFGMEDINSEDEADPRYKDRTPNTQRRIKKEDNLKNVKLLGPWATAFSLFKGFVATGILYMPQNFINGGYGFSTIAMVGSLFLTLYCAKLLLDTRKKLGGNLSFSEIGEKTWGKPGKIMVDITLIGSQFSFVTAYIYFISQNLQVII